MNRFHHTHTPGVLFDPAQTSLIRKTQVRQGLPSVTQDGAIDHEVRRALLTQTLLGAWLAPAMAVGFIFCVSRVLAHERAHRQRISVVVAGWLLCFTAILLTGSVPQRFAALWARQRATIKISI